MGYISKDAHIRRREFLDYIYGLIRYEMHKKDDDEKRLDVLSAMYRDLIYLEDLSKSEAWYSKKKSEDELGRALEKLTKAVGERNKLQEQMDGLLEYINDNKTKKDIIAYVDKVKKSLQP